MLYAASGEELNPKLIKKMLKLMVKLKVKYKQTFIIATHDQSILDIADRVLYLKDGKITKEI